jgi:hypothetical protein
VMYGITLRVSSLLTHRRRALVGKA